MRLRAFVAVAALVLVACAAPARADRLLEYDKLRLQGKVEQGLALLRQELSDPQFSIQRAARGVYLRQRLLIALGEFAALKGLAAEHDAEARKFYQEGIEQFAAGDAELEAYMNDGMFVFFNRTFRPGQSLPFLRKVLSYWEKQRNPFRLYLAQHALATVYLDMGEIELAAHNVDKALRTAEGYFVLGERPAATSEWMEYFTTTMIHMDIAAQQRNVALLQKLWPMRARIGQHIARIGSEAHFQAAEMLAIAGDPAQGRAVLERGKQLWVEERRHWEAEASVGALVVRKSETMLRCAEGGIALWERQFGRAAADLDECIRRWTAERQHVQFQTLYRARGRAREGAGQLADAASDYRFAIAEAEKSRASFTVGERARFFRSAVRGAYWGLVRIQARQGATDETAFFEALSTSEQVRGRQLGELIDPEMSQRISPASLKALQQQLPDDTLVLAYTATEDELVLLALTREQRLATVQPYDGARFAALARATAADLARPSSSSADLEARLLNMSEPVLAAARPLLAGKKRIVALPDGVMNLVPFDLLSADAASYRPLLADFTVSASPSLVFLQHAGRLPRAERSPGLFALADPKFRKPAVLAGASVEEIKVATRGSRFLDYFQPLPETRTEAEAISRMFPGTSLVLAGEQALESQVKARDLRPYAFLHFATHGILGGELPGLDEPALVLGDEPNEDGFLTASEVSKLRLAADLTVLSACNTGSGELVVGEGVMGMSRAFLASGSRAVVVSLWPVASLQTERLMVDFYARLRGGGTPAEALRAAKLAMIEQARKTGSIEAHPFFWAPFIVLGG